MALAPVEVDRDAAVEGVDPLDLSQAPGRVEDKLSRPEGEQSLETRERFTERPRTESDRIDERKEKTILRRLPQGITDAHPLQLGLEHVLSGFHQPEGTIEVACVRQGL